LQAVRMFWSFLPRLLRSLEALWSLHEYRAFASAVVSCNEAMKCTMSTYSRVELLGALVARDDCATVAMLPDVLALRIRIALAHALIGISHTADATRIVRQLASEHCLELPDDFLDVLAAAADLKRRASPALMLSQDGGGKLVPSGSASPAGAARSPRHSPADSAVERAMVEAELITLFGEAEAVRSSGAGLNGLSSLRTVVKELQPVTNRTRRSHPSAPPVVRAAGLRADVPSSSSLLCT
jgi:hypothetical protein